MTRLTAENYSKIMDIAREFCRTNGLDDETAQDLAQDAVLRILDTEENFDSSQSEWTTWIHTIANNTIKDKITGYKYPVGVKKSKWRKDRNKMINSDTPPNCAGVDPLMIRIRYLPHTIKAPLAMVDSERSSEQNRCLSDILMAISCSKYPALSEFYRTWLEDYDSVPDRRRKVIQEMIRKAA
jgi:RNA polymerase sigma factor (sigma-70 family)